MDGKFYPKGETKPVPLSSLVKTDVDRGPGDGPLRQLHRGRAQS